LRAQGASEQALVSALNGRLEIAAADGTIEGVDLAALGLALRDLKELDDFGDLARSGLSGGRTRLERLTGTIALANGVATTTDTAFVLDGGTGEITGRVDLPRWLVDLEARFRLAEPADVPELALGLRGPLDKPERDYRYEPVMAWLAARLIANPDTLPQIGIKLRKGAKAEPGSAIDAALKGVFGDPDQPATPPAPPTGEPVPEPAPTEPEPEPAPRLSDLLKKVIPE